MPKWHLVASIPDTLIHQQGDNDIGIMRELDTVETNGDEEKEKCDTDEEELEKEEMVDKEEIVKSNDEEETMERTDEEKEETADFKDLVSSKLRLTSLLSWFLFFYAALSYYGVVLLSPRIIDGQVCSIVV